MSEYRSAYPLFDPPIVPPPRIVDLNPTVEPEDVPRLNRQHEAILERLRRGPATNAELSQIALRFGGRLHELRRAGHPFGKVNFHGGLFVYFLVGIHSSDEAERYGREMIEREKSAPSRLAT